MSAGGGKLALVDGLGRCGPGSVGALRVDLFLLSVWAAIPFFGATSIGLAYGSVFLTVVGGVPSIAYVTWCTYTAATAFRWGVWPQIKSSLRMGSSGGAD